MNHVSDIVSMVRPRSMFKDIRQNKNKECKYNQNFTEFVVDLSQMRNDNIIDDDQSKKAILK